MGRVRFWQMATVPLVAVAAVGVYVNWGLVGSAALVGLFVVGLLFFSRRVARAEQALRERVRSMSEAELQDALARLPKEDRDEILRALGRSHTD